MVQNKNLQTFIKRLSNSPKNEYDGNSFVLELANTEIIDNIERIESLNEGDALRLNLLCVNERNICQICNENDGEIGVLSSYAEILSQLITDNIIKVVSIVAKNVVPVSKRKKGSKKALVSVKITFDDAMANDSKEVLSNANEAVIEPVQGCTENTVALAQEYNEVSGAQQNYTESVAQAQVYEEVPVATQEYVQVPQPQEYVQQESYTESVAQAQVYEEVPVATQEYVQMSQPQEYVQQESYTGSVAQAQVYEEVPVATQEYVQVPQPQEYVQQESYTGSVPQAQVYEEVPVATQEYVQTPQPQEYVTIQSFEGMSDYVQEYTEVPVAAQEYEQIPQSQEYVTIQSFTQSENAYVQTTTAYPQEYATAQSVDNSVMSGQGYEATPIEPVIQPQEYVEVSSASPQINNSIDEFEPVFEPVVNGNVYIHNIESVRCEIKQIMDEGIWDTNQYLERGRVECKELIKSLSKAISVLKVNKITDEGMLYEVLEVVFEQMQRLYSFIDTVDKKIAECANSLAYVDRGNANPVFNERYNAAIIWVRDNDSNILKLNEGMDRLWNVIPKKQRFENLIEAYMETGEGLLQISKNVVTMTDIYSAPHGVLKYVSASFVIESFDKWQTTYDYLPFVKEKKYKYYVEELEQLKEGFERTKKYYATVRQEKEELLNTIRDERVDCEEQLSSLGIFAFNTKKYCRERIVELEKEEAHARDELNNVDEEYNKIVSEITRKIEAAKTKVAWYATSV